MKKIDLHVHCGLQRGDLAHTNPRNPLDCYRGDCNELRTHLQSQNICKCVLMSGGESEQPDPITITNDECMKIVQAEPDYFAWMCNFDLASPETVYYRMALCKEQGAVGVGELSINQWLDSPFLTAIFTAAQKLDMPIIFHMSPQPGYAYGVCDKAGLPLLEQVLQRFPNLKLLGHSQLFWLEISADCPTESNEARSGMGKGPVQNVGRVTQLMRKYPNLYGDLSAYSGSCAIMRDETHGIAFLEEFSHRLFFATDTVNKHQVFPLAAFLDKCHANCSLSTHAYENICCKNAQRIFGL